MCGCKKCKKKVKAKRSKTRQSRETYTHTQTTTRKTVAVVNFIYKAVDVNDNVDAASCAAFNEFLCMRRETKINEKLQPKKVRERERRSSVSAKESGRNEVQRAHTEREQQGERVGERSRARARASVV